MRKIQNINKGSYLNIEQIIVLKTFSFDLVTQSL